MESVEYRSATTSAVQYTANATADGALRTGDEMSKDAQTGPSFCLDSSSDQVAMATNPPVESHKTSVS